MLKSTEDYPPTHDLDTVETCNDENVGTRLAECQHNKSVTAAYWDPSGRNVVSTCYDDRLRREFLYIFCYQSADGMIVKFGMSLHRSRTLRCSRHSGLSVKSCMTVKL